MVATEAPSGTPSIRLTTPGTKDGSTRGRPMPSIRDAVLSAACPRYDGRNAEPSGSTTPNRVGCRVAHVPAERGRGAAGSGADDDPRRCAVRFEGHLGEGRFGDVVVAAPVRGPFGVGELVEVVPIQLARQPGGDIETAVGSSTRWQRPPSRSMSAILSGLVARAITATNGTPISRAK